MSLSVHLKYSNILGKQQLLGWIICLVCSLVILYLSGVFPGSSAIGWIAAILSIGVGVFVFLRHGGTDITPLGLFCLSFSMFIGVSGAYALLDEASRVDSFYLNEAIALGAVLQIIVGLVGWQRVAVPRVQILGTPFLSRAVWLGIFTLILLTPINLAVGEYPLIESGAFAAVLIVSAALILSGADRAKFWRVLLIAALLLVYVFVFHSGGGRLRVVALACAVATVMSLVWKMRSLKPLVVVGIPVALGLLALQRLTFQESIQSGSSEGRTGLESMTVTINVFARLLQEQSSGLSLSYGENFLSFPLSFLPASVMKDPPQALGYAVVEFYAPGRVGTGFSTAVTAAGEFVYNFGYLGILVGGIALGIICRVLNRLTSSAFYSIDFSVKSFGILLVAVTFSGALADFSWMGWHTYIVRSLTRLPVLLALLMVLHVLGRLRRETRISTQPRWAR